LLRACSLFLLIATLLGSCGKWNWRFDLFAHFRWYYFALAVVGLLLVGRSTNKWARYCLILISIWNGVLLLPYYAPSLRAVASGPAKPFSLISLNVYTANTDKAAVIDYLKTADAELVFAMEVDAQWAEALESLSILYPHRITQPRADNFGVMLLSKRPFMESQIRKFGPTDLPSIVIKIEHDEKIYQLIGTHPVPPVGDQYSSWRNQQLAAIGEFVRQAEVPTIVIGDLNATPWSAAFQSLITQSGLRDSALGFGVLGTWNAKLPVRIPIDHALIPPDVGVLHRTIGPYVGSDHFPLEITLSL